MIKNSLLKRINKFKGKTTKKKILYFSFLNIFFVIATITSITFSGFGFLDISSYIREGGNIANTYLYLTLNAILVAGAGAMIPAIIGTTKTTKEYKKELKNPAKKQKGRQIKTEKKANLKQQISTYTPKRKVMNIEERRKYLEEIREQILSMEIEETYEEEIAKSKSKTK